jgi:hypothetical protein
VPAPELPASLVIVIQLALLEDVQAQPDGPDTPTWPVPAVGASETAFVESVQLHDVPACVTVTVWLPTEIVALRPVVD